MASHVLEGTELYSTLQSELKSYLGDAEYSKRLATVKESYKDIYTDEDAETKFEQELTADLVGDLLFTDKNFVSRLYSGNRNLFQKIFDEVKYLCRVATAGSKQARQLEKIKHTFEQVYKDGSKAQKNTATEDGVRYSLQGYSQHQIANWATSKNIVVYENEQQLRQFIDDARNGKNLSKKMYFGAIPEELAVRIKQDTGIDVESYNCTLRASEIRKIFSNHGDEQTESQRGQRAITEDDFVSIPQIVQNPDEIRLSDELFEGKPVIEFVKTINGKTTVAAYVSKKHLDLTVQTMYSGKNKRNLAPTAGVQAPANTPEAHVGTVPNNSISNPDENVNGKLSLSSKNEDIAPVKDGIYGKDIALEAASNQDLVPV
ncbi:MAG: hypothetical protein UHH95_06150, partial [Oscillospiraceae bacterium]|nr:hypothetical protein [Oscillospiraceae bacterium]